MSTEDTIIEVKDADKTHTIKGTALDAVLTRAHRQGKGAEYVIYFTDANITLTGTLTRGLG